MGQVEMTPASREPVSWHAVTRDLNRYRVVGAMAILQKESSAGTDSECLEGRVSGVDGLSGGSQWRRPVGNIDVASGVLLFLQVPCTASEFVIDDQNVGANQFNKGLHNPTMFRVCVKSC